MPEIKAADAARHINLLDPLHSVRRVSISLRVRYENNAKVEDAFQRRIGRLEVPSSGKKLADTDIDVIGNADSGRTARI